MASNLGFAIARNRLPQSAAALDIHVASFVRYIFQPEVGDVVEGAITNCTSGVALGRLSSGLARMDADAFLDPRQHAVSPTPATWLWATFETILGALLLWSIARSIPSGATVDRWRSEPYGAQLQIIFEARTRGEVKRLYV